MLLFRLLLTPKLQTQTVTDLCSYYYQIVGLNNMSLKMLWLMGSMKMIMQVCCGWGHKLLAVTVTVVPPGWFLNIVPARRLVKKMECDGWGFINTILVNSDGNCVGESHSPLGWARVHRGALFKQDAISLSFISEPNLIFMKVLISLWNHLWMKVDLDNWESWRSPFQDASLNFLSFFLKHLSFDSLWGQYSGRWVTLVCF